MFLQVNWCDVAACTQRVRIQTWGLTTKLEVSPPIHPVHHPSHKSYANTVDFCLGTILCDIK